jgi:hypothetical protein
MRFGRSLPLIAFVLGTTGGFAVAQGHGPYEAVNGSSAAAYAQDYDHHHDDWDSPPHEFREIQRQGFHDGVEGAKKDFDHHRMPDVNNRDEYRHPSVSKSEREDYREGYRRGYDAAMNHLTGQPGPR